MSAVLVPVCLLLAAIAGAALYARSAARRDLREAHRVRAQSEAEARHCPVTGLANHRRACEWLQPRMNDPTVRPAVVRVGFVPFGPGPEREAALALSVARLLSGNAEGESLVARIDPGQYLLALDGTAGSAALVTMARGACASLRRHVTDLQRLGVGVALAIDGDNASTLIERAEQALVRCDERGPVALAFSDPEMREELRQRTYAAEELAAAIAAGRIEPFFQPFVELGTGQVLGFEVLARWRDENGRVRLPGAFVPLAEENGLIGEMYFSLLAAAADEARTWPAEWRFALNLSARQIGSPDLVERTMRTLLDHRIGPSRLEIEIAEEALESNLVEARALVAELRQRGIGVTLDNFGSGGLNLRELAKFRFDRIKVDPAALQGKDAEDTGTALGLIAAAARHLGVPVLVPGIETHAGATAAQVQGGAIGQGFMFGRPDRQTDCFRLEGALAGGKPRVA